MTPSQICVALDTSARVAGLAVARNGELILETTMPATGKASRDLAPSLGRAIAELGVKLTDVDTWLVGMGPGSFSGIRSSAALIKGIAKGSGARCGGVASSHAMALAINPAAPRIVVLHDGRRGEVICSPFNRSDSGELTAEKPFATPIDELSAQAPAQFVMLADDPARPAAEIATPNMATLLAIPVDLMVTLPPGPMAPIYVRPAVFVAPRAPVNNP